jgi:hypothetical protein
LKIKKLNNKGDTKMKKQLILTLLVMFIAASVFAQRTLNPDNIKTISGTITSIEHPVAKFKADDGTEYDLRMGPYRYWQNNNYSLTTTDATVKGEVNIKNGVNEIYPSEIEQSGSTIKLTNDKGFPLWSKGGKAWNKGNGKGWKKGNGKGWNKGQCRMRLDNKDDNSGWQGRGFGNRGRNCPYGNR